MKNLESIFNAKTVALVGATGRPGSVGAGVLKNLIEGKSERKIFGVNPKEKEIMGVECFKSIKDIKEDIDLAIIAVPATAVKEVVKECSEKKVSGIIIISAGFAESGKEGRILQDEVAEIARSAGIPLVGPNCLGILRPEENLNASFAPLSPKSGSVAFLSQSGALIDSIVDQSLEENFGFSALVSYGNEADLKLNDFLEFFEKDENTKVIAVYLEGIKEGRKFMEVAKRITKKKPILVLKAGKTDAGRKAALSHSASLAGEARVFSSVFKQCGILEVESFEELFDNVKALAWQPKCENSFAIITNGGGAGVLSADYCQELGVNLTELKSKTIERIESSGKMNPSFSRANPLDIIGDATAERYEVALNCVLEQEDVAGVLIIQTLQIMTDPKENANIIIKARKKWEKKPIVCAFLGGKITKEGSKILEENKIPNYPDLKRAVRALKSLIY